MKHFIKKKDGGFAAVPWVLMTFFLGVLMFLFLFYQSMGMAAKYMVQDALASAALAGEVVDMDILSSQDEYLITDLSKTRALFEDTLKQSLRLDAGFRPVEDASCFVRDMPVEIQELTLYNVSGGQVYKTDLLRGGGVLDYREETGLAGESRAVCMGNLLKQEGKLMEGAKDGDYNFSVTMLDGEKKKIKGTSLYARIRLGVRSYGGGTAVVEKDILTDVVENN